MADPLPPPPDRGRRWRILSLGGLVGLLTGAAYGSLTKLGDIDSKGFAYFLGGVIFVAQVGLVLGAIVGWLIARSDSRPNRD